MLNFQFLSYIKRLKILFSTDENLIKLDEIDKKHPLIPEKFLRMNFDESIMRGMNADLFWDFGEGIGKYPVQNIIKHMFGLINEGEFLEILKNRINERRSPIDKLIEDTKKLGYNNAIDQYLKSFQNEVPYV